MEQLEFERKVKVRPSKLQNSTHLRDLLLKGSSLQKIVSYYEKAYASN